MGILARPSKRDSDFEYERVVVDEWIEGVIEDVQVRKEQRIKWGDNEKVVDQVRFKFKLNGCEYLHYSRWMTLSSSEKSNLYQKYIKPIFKDQVKPDTLWNMERLIGLRVRTMWTEDVADNGDVYQHVAQIRGLDQSQVDMVNLVVDEDVQEEPSF